MYVISVIIFTAVSTSLAIDLGNCKYALGIESGQIKDSAITASSSYDAGSVGPQFARLRQDKNGGAWCPKQQVMRGIKEWIEIDLKSLHVISAVQTQGRFGNGQGQEYVEEFKIEYWRPGMEKWAKYRDRMGSEILSGNTNTYTVVENRFDPVIIAWKIRLVPYSLHRRTVCLRLELFGCLYQEGVVSYSTPQGDILYDVALVDDMYDGIIENGYLKGGLGQLTDGIVGHDNIDLDMSGHGKGYEWIGWQNKTNAPRKHLELIFEFDTVRNFSHMDLYMNNDFGKNIQVFSELRVFFSIGGRHFSEEAVHYIYMPDIVVDRSRNVSIHMAFQLGRYLKLQFYFATEWMLISEVYFVSEKVEGNFTEEVRAGGHSEENHLQRDAIANTKSTDENVAMMNEESSSHTGVIIGIMSVIIIALVGTIVTMSIRNCKQNGGRSILPTSFAGVSLKDLGLGFKGSNGDFHFASANSEPLYAPVKMNEAGFKADKAVIYNEPVVHSLENSSGSYSTLQSKRSPFTRANDLTGSQEYAVPIQHYSTVEPPLFSTSQRRSTVHSRSSFQGMFNSNSPLVLHSSIKVGHQCNSVTPSSISTEEGGFYAATDLLRQRGTEPSSESSDNEYQIPPISASKLNISQRLGQGYFGEAHLCSLMENETEMTVLVKGFPPHYSRLDVMEECKLLYQLRHSNLLPIVGLTVNTQDPKLIFEYGHICDLWQYLQEHVAETTPINGRILSYGCLIYIAKQIAAAMEYLESFNIVHRDLAARNCMVYTNYTVKIGTFGMNRDLYPLDYFALEGEWIPIRWMAWETLTLGKFTTRSDVWSFAVVLWEILTFAREQPLEQLADEDVVHLLMQYCRNNADHVLLAKPILCPKEIYDLMCECWQRSEIDRPTFKEIHMFLMRKNLGYDPATS